LFGPSPDTSITRRVASKPLSSRSFTPKSMAPEIEVRCARRRGVEAMRSAKAMMPSGFSSTVQGTITFWSREPAHSK
jgi:hypothetical protein